MSLTQTIRIAWQALFRNKLRSFLTMLGIVIGVFAVIAMVAVGEGAQAVVQGVFSSMGSNMLVVMSGASKQGGAFGGFGTLPTLTWDDLKAIKREIPSVRFGTAVLHPGAQVQSDDRNWSTSVNGVSPQYFDIRDWPMASGVRFTPSDVDTGRKVAVLGQTVVDHLFGFLYSNETASFKYFFLNLSCRCYLGNEQKNGTIIVVTFHTRSFTTYIA